MAPICLQFWGANANRYYEYSGAAGMRALWMDAIHVTHPEWVEIITWNDFIEGTYVSPIDDPNKYPGANFLDVKRHSPWARATIFTAMPPPQNCFRSSSSGTKLASNQRSPTTRFTTSIARS